MNIGCWLLVVGCWLREERKGFNSLQTGKHIQRLKRKWRQPLRQRFNSLQTGKHIQSSEEDESEIKRELANGFNSLQTGKHIQRLKDVLRVVGSDRKVSIPFKRESIYKVKENRLPCADISYQCFNSLQTGKHIQSQSRHRLIVVVNLFQFPSNGKAYTKVCARGARTRRNGHKFQFPSNGKAYTKVWREIHKEIKKPQCFNSLQTGKHIQSLERNIATEAEEFQFPSNGKAYTKHLLTFRMVLRGNGCFNSLQTGKHIQSDILCVPV